MDESMVQYILVGFAISIIVNFVMDQLKRLYHLWRDRETEADLQDHFLMERRTPRPTPPPPIPGQHSRNGSTPFQGTRRGRVTPPPMPAPVNTRMQPGDFPRCPIHRCCNRPGTPQKIFWDGERHMWRCYKNHYFQS